MTEHGKYDPLYREDRNVCGDPYPEFVRFFAEYSVCPAAVLDLGCGQGRDALMVARLGHDVLGVDISPTGIRQMVEVADAEGLSVQGHVADLTEYEIDRTYDIILLDRVLHMLAPQPRAQLLGQAARRVKPGGHILIADQPGNMPSIVAVLREDASTWTHLLARRGFLIARRDREA